MIFKTRSIDWDTDDDKEVFDGLPQQVTVDVENEDEIADALSDNYGWCMFGFEVDRLMEIKLSNDQVLRIEEGDDCLHIAAMHDGYVDGYICEISANGTLVMPNSGDAGECLTQGLKKPKNGMG